MDSSDMKRLRAPGFPIARRGYEQRAVDMFLARLADWLETDAATDLGQVAVARKLELVGKSTAHILLATEQESEQMRRRAHEECAELRSEAKAAALATRQAADEYATKVRDKAEQDARRAADAASAKAKQTIEEGERRRAQSEEVVSELNARRNQALAELDKLQAEIGSTIERHRPGKPRQGARGSDRTNDRAEKPADGAGQPTERRPKQGRAAAPPSSR
jgi:cell division septum initiation protein DivIVA